MNQTNDTTNFMPIIVVGNKNDISSSASPNLAAGNGRQVSRNLAEAEILEKQCLFAETSAKDDDNVKQLFAELLLSVYGVDKCWQLGESEDKGQEREKKRTHANHSKCLIM